MMSEPVSREEFERFKDAVKSFAADVSFIFMTHFPEIDAEDFESLAQSEGFLHEG